MILYREAEVICIFIKDLKICGKIKIKSRKISQQY